MCVLHCLPAYCSPQIILRYNLMYEQQAGGAISVTSSLFRLLNGFSNSFYGNFPSRIGTFPICMPPALIELFRPLGRFDK